MATAVKKTKSATKSSTKNPSKSKVATKSKQTKKTKSKKEIEGNFRSALSRQVIEGTYDIEQCRHDIESFTTGMSSEWKQRAYEILDTVIASKNPQSYFESLCHNALTNVKHNYNGIPVIRYWQ